jgi:hypothetical protein
MIIGQNFNGKCVTNTYDPPDPGPAPGPAPPSPGPGPPSPTPAGGFGNQQFLGPTQGTNWAIMLKASCTCTGTPEKCTDCTKCVDLEGGKAIQNAKVDIWDCNGAINQQWTLDPTSQQIKSNVDNTFCIDAGAGSVKATQLMLWGCNDQDQQKWKGGGNYQLELASKPTMCLDLTSGKRDNGNPMQIWPCVSSGPAPAPPPAPPPPPPTPPAPSTNQMWLGPTEETKGTIMLRASCTCTGTPEKCTDCTKCLDVAGGKTDIGTPVDIWDCNQSDNQQVL